MKLLDTDLRFEIAGAVGLSGAVVALALTGADRHLAFDWGFVRVACAGAFVAGLGIADGFGHRGWQGLLLGGISFVIATMFGAVIAFLLMPFEAWWVGAVPMPSPGGPFHFSQCLIAPVYVAASVIASLPLAGIWIACALGVQKAALCRRGRAETWLNPGNCGWP